MHRPPHRAELARTTSCFHMSRAHGRLASIADAVRALATTSTLRQRIVHICLIQITSASTCTVSGSLFRAARANILLIAAWTFVTLPGVALQIMHWKHHLNPCNASMVYSGSGLLFSALNLPPSSITQTPRPFWHVRDPNSIARERTANVLTARSSVPIACDVPAETSLMIMLNCTATSVPLYLDWQCTFPPTALQHDDAVTQSTWCD